MGVIDPLTNPTAHGGSADDAFHLVIPSLPGYGWSGKPASTGCGVAWIATAWNTLMHRLGYDSYVAQGGDWGALVTTYIGMQNLGNVRAIHTNMPVASPTPESLENPTEEGRSRRSVTTTSGTRVTRNNSDSAPDPRYDLVDSAAGRAAWIP